MNSKEDLYRQRLSRYLTAMRNEKPDRIPIRPFVAEFTAKYAGMTCQDVTHDYNRAFEAVRRCAADFDWDAVVSNMVYVWTGHGVRVDRADAGHRPEVLRRNTGFQYREPPEDAAYMQPEEYDAFIEDPTGWLFHVWLPRISTQYQRNTKMTPFIAPPTV
jgi:hypothetical protein